MQFWENIAQPGRSPMTTWRMRIVCSIPDATNTHSECVIIIACPYQQWLHEHISMLHFTNTTSHPGDSHEYGWNTLAIDSK
jgi:hypothetical protein